MKKFNAILILLLTFLIEACDPYDGRLSIINHKSDTVFVLLSVDGHFKEYPIKFDKADTLWTHIRYISPNDSTEVLSMGRNSWENTINKNYKDSTITIFFFDRELLKSLPPDSLLSKQLYSKKFTYKVKDLEKLNWRVEYK